MCFKTRGIYKCGKCPECLQERRLQWSLRLIEHSRKERCFSALLTYNNNSVPLKDGKMSLRKRDVQLFLKRLRHVFKKPFKYYISAEYSPEKFRPHYHCLFFGFDESLSPYEIRLLLETTWGLGFCGSRSNWIKDDAQIHYVTSYLINLYDWHDDDVRQRPFNLISKGLGTTCDKLENIPIQRYYAMHKYGWFYDKVSKTLLFNSPLSLNVSNNTFDVADDFIENIGTIKIQQTHFNPRTKTTTLGEVQTFPLPRIWRERYLTSTEREILNFINNLKANKEFLAYQAKYGEYDKTTDFPMWKQQKYLKWSQRKKNKKDKLLSNPDIYFL